jgi:hypothetical protein
MGAQRLTPPTARSFQRGAGVPPRQACRWPARGAAGGKDPGGAVFAYDMEPNGLNRASAGALVLRAIHDIDESSAEQRDVLLMDLLCAAWGSLSAQNQ